MSEANQYIYFDNNATTQLDRRVLDVMVPFYIDSYANPHSAHYFGNEVNKAIEEAREQVAELIGATSQEVIFTSGSTEAINIALKGVAELSAYKGKHIITVTTEHQAVLDTCKHLETKGYEITYLDVCEDGIVKMDELKASLRPDTVLVCVMYVNNETGVIQPIKEIGSLVSATQALFFTDATQAAGKISIDVNDLGVDLLCISGHKMHGPKGVGALYIKNGIKLPTYTHGGGQERGLRSGTLNAPGIVAMGIACELCKRGMNEDASRIGQLRDKLEEALLQIPGTFVNGNKERRVYNITNVCFRGYDANVLIGRMKNIAVSNGSACTSAILEPSHVLTAIGLSDEDAFASMRFSLGRFNTEDEVHVVVKTIFELMQTYTRHA